MSLSAWLTILLALPVLILGERLVKRIKILSRFHIPSPVAGGLFVALILLVGNLSGLWSARFESKVSAPWWTWIVTAVKPENNVNAPFLVAFFTCIGLNASWVLVKRGSVQVFLFLGLSSFLAVTQNLVGVGLAKLMSAPPLLGLMCGSVAMTGGHGTALGFAAEFQKAGFDEAAVIGAAAATFGLVAGGILGGPLGGGLIRRHKLQCDAPLSTHLESGGAEPAGIFPDLRNSWLGGRRMLLHLLVLLVCMKLGAWVSWYIQKLGVTFPIYIGAMLVGLLVRNALDLVGKSWIRTESIDLLASVALGFFLTIAMMSLNLIELAATALPMLVILGAQVVIVGLFGWFVTFRLMGRDYEAAVLTAGHCGFSLGATPNAMANMKALVEGFGPAPRAFLIVPVVGGFLIDLINASNITIFLNLLKQP